LVSARKFPTRANTVPHFPLLLEKFPCTTVNFTMQFSDAPPKSVGRSFWESGESPSLSWHYGTAPKHSFTLTIPNIRAPTYPRPTRRDLARQIRDCRARSVCFRRLFPQQKPPRLGPPIASVLPSNPCSPYIHRASASRVSRHQRTSSNNHVGFIRLRKLGTLMTSEFFKSPLGGITKIRQELNHFVLRFGWFSGFHFSQHGFYFLFQQPKFSNWKQFSLPINGKHD
jgi:hypothetical protein